MVKVTTGFIDVYQSKDGRLADVHQRFDNKKKFKEIILRESSDSDSSSFDESDENDDMATCLLKLKNDRDNQKQKFQSNTKIDMLCSPRLSRKRYTSHQDISRRQTNSKIDILCSPRLSRKNCTLSFQDLTGSTRSSIDTYCTPRLVRKALTTSSQDTQQENVKPTRPTSLTPCENPTKPHSFTTKSAPSTPSSEEDLDYKRNSYLQSPRVKRKQIDITSSAAYKEIYASNLRLYSAVLAKQIASSGQVGREMNEMRRIKIKEKALEKSGKNQFNRSYSFAEGDVRATIKEEDNEEGCHNGHPQLRYKRSNSAGANVLQNDVRSFLARRNELTPCSHVKVIGDNEGCADALSEDEEPIEHKRTQSASEIRNTTTSNAEIITRRRAATLRSQHLRQKIQSFDETMDETNKFLDKIKTARK